MGFLPINVAGVAPADDFNYPAGEYILSVKEAKMEPTKDGTGNRLVIKTNIIMGPNSSLEMQNKPLTHSYYLSEKSRPFLMRFALAAGVTQEQIAASGGQLDTDWFTGKQYMARISMKNEYTNVDRERPLAAWTHGGIAGQPAAAPAGAPPASLLNPLPTAAPPMAAPPVAAPPQNAFNPTAAYPATYGQPQPAAPVAPVAQAPMQQQAVAPQQQVAPPPMAAPPAAAPTAFQQPPGVAPPTAGVPMPVAPPAVAQPAAAPVAGLPAPPPPVDQVPQS